MTRCWFTSNATDSIGSVSTCQKRRCTATGAMERPCSLLWPKRCARQTADERLALRQEHSLPLLDAFDAWVDEQEKTLGKTGKLAEAVGYAKNQRTSIRRCFSEGRFEIDNGACERAIREPAIGRKNFLFAGSADAAHSYGSSWP